MWGDSKLESGFRAVDQTCRQGLQSLSEAVVTCVVSSAALQHQAVAGRLLDLQRAFQEPAERGWVLLIRT